MQIIVQLTHQAAQSAHNHGFNTPSLAQLAQIVSAQNAQLAPMYPGQSDLELMTFFVVDLPNYADAAGLMTALQEHLDVRSVYIQPPAEPA